MDVNTKDLEAQFPELLYFSYLAMCILPNIGIDHQIANFKVSVIKFKSGNRGKGYYPKDTRIEQTTSS